MSRFLKCIGMLALALWLPGVVVPTFGQGTDLGIIRGTVTDSQGAVVVGARVTITDLATGIAIERLSNAAGDYEAVNLKSGTYKITVGTEGFNNTEVLDVVVRTGATSRVDVKLSPKGRAEVITVTSEAPLIQTEAPVVSGTLNTQQIQDLPRDSRDIYQFLYLNPNIIYNPDDGFKFMGGSSYGANFSMDGQRATGAGFGQAVGGQPSLETIGEVTVLSNSFSAEYGGIANIRVTTKRGTAGYHGSLFYDNKNSALASWRATDKIDQANFTPSYFQPSYPHPSFNFTEAGGSFGGPIPKMGKRTFFMFAFEKRWDAEPVRWSSSNKVPHETLLTGDFSKLADGSKPAVPAGTSLTADEIKNYTVGGLGTQFIKIPSRLLSPYTTKLVNLYFPHTSVDAPINNKQGYVPGYTNLTRGLLTRPLYTGRIDHDFSDRDRVYGVINFSTQDGGFTMLNNPFSSLGTAYAERSNQTLSLSEIHNFKPTLINEVRGGLNIQNSYRRANAHVKDILTSIGFSQADIQAYADGVSPLAPDFWGTFPIIEYFGPSGNFGNMGRGADRTLNQRMWSIGDTVSWIKGKHSIRGGFDLVHNYVEDAFTIGRGQPRGRLSYSNNLNGWTSFLMGLPANSINRNIAPRGPMHATNWEHGYFVQDDWKITPRLTLNLGLRYELITPFTEQDDLLVNFDFNYKNPKTGELGRFVFPSEKTIPFADPRQIAYGYVLAKDLDLSRGLVRTDGNNFAPRVGVAFRLTEKTVLRGGYGIFYPTSAAQGMRDSMATNSFNQSITLQNKPANPLQPWPRPFTGGVQNAITQYPSINAIPFDLQQPRIQQFNVTFEREVGWKTAVRVSYLGSRVWGLGAGIDQNAVKPSDNPLGTTTGDGVTPCTPVDYDCDISPADQARIPYPHLGDWLMINGGNFGVLRSNALQIEVNRSLAKGLMFNFSYTYLDQKNTVTDADSSLGDPVYDPFNAAGDYGWDSFVTKHRFIAYGTWDVPVGQGRRLVPGNKFLNAVVGGWQSSWHLFAKSGTGFTPYYYCNGCGPAMPGNIFTTAISPAGWNGSTRPLVVGDPNKRSGDFIWDASAFAPPSVGADFFSNPKNATRNMLIGPSVWAANFAVTKDFRINEGLKLSFRAVFDNVFNHPTFAPPGPGQSEINYVGDFDLEVDPNTLKLLPITSVYPNPDFGRLYGTFSHEGIDDRRSIRISLRLVF